MTVLATRFNHIIGSYIHKDQVGFIKGQYMRDKVRQLLNVIELALCSVLPNQLYFLDVYKAFDRVEQPFLKPVLKVMVWTGIPALDYYDL